MSKKTLVKVSGVYYFKWPGEYNDRDTRFSYFLNFDTDSHGNLCMDDESQQKHQKLLKTLEADIKTASEKFLVTSWRSGLIMVEIKEDNKESKAEAYNIDRLQFLKMFTNYAKNQLAKAEFMPDSNILMRSDNQLLQRPSKVKLTGVGHMRVSGVIAFTDGKGGIIDTQIGNNIEFEVRDGGNWYISPKTLSSYHGLADQFNEYLEEAENAELLNNHWYHGAMIVETNWRFFPDGNGPVPSGQEFAFIDILNLDDLKTFRNYVIEKLPWAPGIPDDNNKQLTDRAPIGNPISSLKQPLLLTKYPHKGAGKAKPETDEKQEGVLEFSARKLRQCFSC